MIQVVDAQALLLRDAFISLNPFGGNPRKKALKTFWARLRSSLMVRALSSALFSLLPFGCELLKNALHVTCCLAPEKSLQKPTQASARNKSSTLKLPYQLKTDEDCHLTLGAAGEKKKCGSGALDL